MESEKGQFKSEKVEREENKNKYKNRKWVNMANINLIIILNTNCLNTSVKRQSFRIVQKQNKTKQN